MPLMVTNIKISTDLAYNKKFQIQLGFKFIIILVSLVSTYIYFVND